MTVESIALYNKARNNSCVQNWNPCSNVRNKIILRDWTNCKAKFQTIPRPLNRILTIHVEIILHHCTSYFFLNILFHILSSKMCFPVRFKKREGEESPPRGEGGSVIRVLFCGKGCGTPQEEWCVIHHLLYLWFIKDFNSYLTVCYDC